MPKPEPTDPIQEEGVYYLRVYDNAHYMDESEAYTKGPFVGAEAALAAARAIVNDYVESGGGGFSGYKLFGDDPVITGSPHVTFSAWDYAAERYRLAEEAEK